MPNWALDNPDLDSIPKCDKDSRVHLRSFMLPLRRKIESNINLAIVKKKHKVKVYPR